MRKLRIFKLFKVQLWLAFVLFGFASSVLSLYWLYKYAEDLFYTSPIYEIKVIGLTVSTVILSVAIVLQCTMPLVFMYLSVLSYELDSLGNHGKMSTVSKTFSVLTMASFALVFATFFYYNT